MDLICSKSWLCLEVCPAEKQNLFMMNGNEAKDVLGDSRNCYRARAQR